MLAKEKIVRHTSEPILWLVMCTARPETSRVTYNHNSYNLQLMTNQPEALPGSVAVVPGYFRHKVHRVEDI